MRKIICSLLSICILSISFLNVFTVTASSSSSVIKSLKDGYPYYSIVKYEMDNNSLKVDNLKSDLCKKIYSSLVNGNMNIYIADLNILMSDDNEQIIQECIIYLMRICPFLFYWSDFSLTFYDNSFIYTRLEIESDNANISNLSAELDDYNNLLNQIIDKIPENISELSKILYIYDYLGLNYEYDTSYSNYDGYTFLKTKKGVCQAYTEVFNLLMYKLGIPCTNALDDTDQHTWNIVLLNGKYYHIDSTWGDPVPDTYGFVNHNMFLLSDDTIMGMQLHSEFFTFEELFGLFLSCDDTKYESDYLWNNSVSTFAFSNGQAFFISKDCKLGINGLETKIYKTNDYLNKTEVQTISESKYFMDEGDNPVFKSGISIIGSQIYYNTTNEIRYYDINTGSSGVAFTTDNTNPLLYSYYDGDGLFKFSSYVIGIKNDYQVENNKASVYGAGDLNGDLKIDSLDITIMRNYLLSGSKKGACFAKLDDISNKKMTVLDLINQKRMCLQNQ